MAAASTQTLCHGFASSTSGCSHDSVTCEHVQDASASVGERPLADAEPPDGEGNPDWGHASVDRWLTRIH
eukprot:10997765-Lingulodinium_polyedra.AAC.1